MSEFFFFSLRPNDSHLIWSKDPPLHLPPPHPYRARSQRSPDEMENGNSAGEDDGIDDNDEGGNYFDQMGWELTGGDDIPRGAQVCYFSNAPFGRFLSPPVSFFQYL